MSVDLLDQLNPQQREAARAIDGPVLIFAGAGSGKTRALTYRIAYMIRHAGIPPHQILAVTFTNKAAEEMKSRIVALVGEEARGLWAGTFHSVCARILRADGERIGVPRNFVVFDEGDQRTLVKQVLRDLNYDTEIYKPADVLTAIGRAKDELLTPEDYRARAKGPFEKVVAAVYPRYQKALADNAALDFDDLIFKTVELFLTCPDVLDRWQERFRYILVDEYQDINYAQYRFVTLLAAKYRNICVVGDDDQSIYGWRGANVKLILRFHEDYPEAKVIFLEQNYRSTQRILDCANAIISRNPTRAPKKLWTRNPNGSKPVVYEAINETEEAAWVAQEIRRLVSEGYRYGDIAVLYRTNAMSRHFEEVFMQEAIPYKVVGGVRFYERAEVKDILAYLRLIHNPADNVSARRAMVRPPRGIGKKTLEAVEELVQREGLSVLEACRRLAESESLRPASRRALAGFVGLIDELQAKAGQVGLADLVKLVVERSGYVDWLRSSARADQQSKADNVEEFVNMAAEFQARYPGADLSQFLEHVALMSDIDEAGELGNAVALMTLHAAKGLEFPVVFIVGMEQGTFPHERSLGSEEEMAEERRLCYVGITRAKERLYMSYCLSRFIYGRSEPRTASQFLKELPSDAVEFIGTGLFAEPGKPAVKVEDAEARAPDRGIDMVSLLETAKRGGRRQRAALSGGRAQRLAQQGKSASAADSERSQSVELRAGQKINHPKFGVGTVVAVEGSVATVVFEGAGIKKLAVDFVRPEWVKQ